MPKSKADLQATRSVVIDGEAHLVAKDVAEALGYSRPDNFYRSVKEKYRVPHKVRGHQKMTCISEPGLWKALSTVRDNEIAERFQDWLYEEHLPSVRRNGHHNGISEQQDLAPIEVLQQTVTHLAQMAEKQEAMDQRTKNEADPHLREIFANVVDGRCPDRLRLSG